MVVSGLLQGYKHDEWTQNHSAWVWNYCNVNITTWPYISLIPQQLKVNTVWQSREEKSMGGAGTIQERIKRIRGGKEAEKGRENVRVIWGLISGKGLNKRSYRHHLDFRASTDNNLCNLHYTALLNWECSYYEFSINVIIHSTVTEIYQHSIKFYKLQIQNKVSLKRKSHYLSLNTHIFQFSKYFLHNHD